MRKFFLKILTGNVKQGISIFLLMAIILSGFGWTVVFPVHAMTSTNYGIDWDSINSGGADLASSTNYSLRDTLGEQGTGSSTSTSYQLNAGYRFAGTETTTLSFEIGTQENGTGVTYSAFQNVGKTVTVSSVTGFAVGDYIGVIEDVGLSQMIAIAKIVSIAGSVLTVDQWSGDQASMSASPVGGDDMVYRMHGSSAQLGTLSVSAGATSLTRTNVVSNVSGGYTVYVSTDGALRVSPSVVIADVADGAVTIGSEEYGAETIGTVATSTGSDFAFTTTTRAIQQSSTFADNDRIGLMYKASISTSTAVGSYSQHVYYTLTANY